MAKTGATAGEYFDVLALLQRALESLDALEENVAAAHLSGVIDIVSEGVDRASIH